MHSLPADDLLASDLLALDVEFFLEEILFDDLLVLDAADGDAADVLYDLVVCNDLVYADVLDCPGPLDVDLCDADVHLVDLVLLLVDGDFLDDVSLGDPDVDLVDLDVIEPYEGAVVHLLVDVLVDILGLDVHCRWQLASCGCSFFLSLSL